MRKTNPIFGAGGCHPGAGVRTLGRQGGHGYASVAMVPAPSEAAGH
jgi:hypothetical protein